MHAGHTKGATSFTLDVRENNKTYRVIIANMGSINPGVKVTGMPGYPTIGDDYAKTFLAQKDMKIDVLFAPHPEMYKMQEKRAKLSEGGPNPFVNPGEFNTYAATLEKAFQDALAKQTAAAQEKRG